MTPFSLLAYFVVLYLIYDYIADEWTENDMQFSGYDIPETREELKTYLDAAMSLELSTLPIYLTIYLSLKPESGGPVSRVRDQLFDICKDEMLHLALISNLQSSIYGSDEINVCYNIEYGPNAQLPAEVMPDIDDLSLKPYSKEALWTAVQIESPASMVHENPFDLVTQTSAFEPDIGENSVTLKFHKFDHHNQIGEFYEAIKTCILNLAESGMIEFNHDSEHRQRQCQAVENRPVTGPIDNVDDAIAAIELIQEMGEGYDMNSGIFAPVVDQDSDNNIENDIERMHQTPTDKSHFIQFVEMMVGRELIELKLESEDDETVTYEFVYETGDSLTLDESNYWTNEEIEVNYQDGNEEHCWLNENYEDLLNELTKGFKQGTVTQRAITQMLDLETSFNQCVEYGVIPNWQVNCESPPRIE